MVKILHAAALLRPPLGVLNQMAWEQEAASILGAAWHARMYCPTGSAPDSDIAYYAPSVQIGGRASHVSRLHAWVRLRRNYYRWLFQIQSEYDALLLRYYVHDPFQLSFVGRAEKPVYFVHHTLEEPELASAGGLIGAGRAWAESLLGGRTIQKARGLICVTSEIARYEIERLHGVSASTYIYSNGITYSGKIAADKRGGVPQILFVASEFAAWHGLDRLLESVSRFRGRFLLHLVGFVGADDRAVAKQDSRIVLHDRLSHDGISQLAESCDVGLSSFALDRKRMTEACTLKVREYLMLGLPVYAGHRDVFPEDFTYYRHGPAEIEAIIGFAQELRTVSREAVSEAARPHIDKQALLGNLLDFIRRDLQL